LNKEQFLRDFFREKNDNSTANPYITVSKIASLDNSFYQKANVTLNLSRIDEQTIKNGDHTKIFECSLDNTSKNGREEDSRNKNIPSSNEHTLDIIINDLECFKQKMTHNSMNYEDHRYDMAAFNTGKFQSIQHQPTIKSKSNGNDLNISEKERERLINRAQTLRPKISFAGNFKYMESSQKVLPDYGQAVKDRLTENNTFTEKKKEVLKEIIVSEQHQNTKDGLLEHELNPEILNGCVKNDDNNRLLKTFNGIASFPNREEY